MNMGKNISLSNLVKIFEEVEKKFDLGNHQIANVNWWDFLRDQTYEELQSQLKLKDPRFSLKEKKILDESKLKQFFIFTKKIINNFYKVISSNSPIWIRKNSNIIFGHPRRVFENNFYVDKYVDPFIDTFENKIDFSVIEIPINSTHLQPIKTKNLFFSEIFIFLSIIFGKFINVKLSKNELFFIQKLQNEFKNKFNVKINLIDRLKDYLPKYKSDYIIYKYFFKIKKPKKIFIVASYGYEAMIGAAKSLKISTYELQHGSPARANLVYDYSSGIKKSNFPEFFLSFGKMWTNDIALPLNKKNIIEIGFPYLNEKLNKNRIIIKKEKMLLVIAQPYYSKKLISFSIKLKEKLGNKVDVYFKPHPIELLKNTYLDYAEKLKKNNIHIIKSYKTDLYELLYNSKWVLGISSTALYEALAFKCKVFSLKDTTHEFILRLEKKKMINLVSSVDDFEKLMHLEVKNNETLFFNDKNKTIKFLFLNE